LNAGEPPRIKGLSGAREINETADRVRMQKLDVNPIAHIQSLESTHHPAFHRRVRV
jgi:hypothetical protein